MSNQSDWTLDKICALVTGAEALNALHACRPNHPLGRGQRAPYRNAAFTIAGRLGIPPSAVEWLNKQADARLEPSIADLLKTSKALTPTEDEEILKTLLDFIKFAHSGLSYCYPLNGLQRLHEAANILIERTTNNRNIDTMTLSGVTTREQAEKRARANIMAEYNRHINSIYKSPGQKMCEAFARFMLGGSCDWHNLDPQTRAKWEQIAKEALS